MAGEYVRALLLASLQRSKEVGSGVAFGAADCPHLDKPPSNTHHTLSLLLVACRNWDLNDVTGVKVSPTSIRAASGKEHRMSWSLILQEGAYVWVVWANPRNAQHLCTH